MNDSNRTKNFFFFFKKFLKTTIDIADNTCDMVALCAWYNEESSVAAETADAAASPVVPLSIRFILEAEDVLAVWSPETFDESSLVVT